MNFYNCIFCKGFRAQEFEIRTKRSYRNFVCCTECGGISAEPEQFLSPEQQRERYLKHHNTLADSGYKQFLCSFMQAVFDFSGGVCARPSSILDYGSGPEPALVQLLKTSAAADAGQELFGSDVLKNTLHIAGWDPFFAPGCPELAAGLSAAGSALPREFDLVTCLEVAEHFENPHASFADIAAMCRTGGYAAVGTLPVPEPMRIPEDFKSWWYKDDRTHVSFYTEKAAAACGKQAGLAYEGMASSRIFMFRKIQG